MSGSRHRRSPQRPLQSVSITFRRRSIPVRYVASARSTDTPVTLFVPMRAGSDFTRELPLQAVNVHTEMLLFVCEDQLKSTA